MAKKKAATKYVFSRSDISERLREILEKLEDSAVFDQSPNDLDTLINEVVNDVTVLSDDVNTKAY